MRPGSLSPQRRIVLHWILRAVLAPACAICLSLATASSLEAQASPAQAPPPDAQARPAPNARETPPQAESNSASGRADPQNSNENSRQDRGAADAPASEGLAALKRAADWLDAIWNLIATPIALIGLGGLALWRFRRSLRQDRPFLEDFRVAQTLAARGYDGRTVALRLVDCIRAIQTSAERSQRRLEIQSEDARAAGESSPDPEDEAGDSSRDASAALLRLAADVPDIELPGAGLTLRQAEAFARGLLRRPRQYIQGDAVLAEDGRIQFTLRLSGRAVFRQLAPENRFEELLEDAARALLAQLAPFLLALHYSAAGQAERAWPLVYELHEEDREDREKHAGPNHRKMEQRKRDGRAQPGEAQLLAAFLLLEEGQYAEALARADEARERLADPRPALAIRRDALARQGRLHDALQTQDQLDASQGGASAASLCDRGDLYIRAGKSEEALQQYDAAIERDGEYARAHLQRGYALERLQRGTESAESPAARSFYRALEIDPGLAVARVSLAYHLARVDPERAILESRRALQIDPQYAAALASWGAALAGRGDLRGALEKQREAARLEPRRAAGWLALGRTLLTLEEYAESRAALERALAVKPDYALAAFYLGQVLERMNLQTEAVAAYRRASELAPDSARFRSFLEHAQRRGR